MQAFSNAFKSPTRNCVSPVPPDDMGLQELDCMESVLVLVEGLSLDKPYDCLRQFIDSVVFLKIVPLLQRCLSLSHGNTQLVSNTLAALILILLYLPDSVDFVEDVLFGKYLEGSIKYIKLNVIQLKHGIICLPGRIPNVEFHKLLRNNEDASIRERTCIILFHLDNLSSDSLENIWHQTLTNDIEFLKNDPCHDVAQVHEN